MYGCLRGCVLGAKTTESFSDRDGAPAAPAWRSEKWCYGDFDKTSYRILQPQKICLHGQQTCKHGQWNALQEERCFLFAEVPIKNV